MNLQKEMDKALARYKKGRWNGWVENRGMQERFANEALKIHGPFDQPVETRQQRRQRERHS